MECTQRLECTQELYETHTQRICPEQIGFLGICGEKHPVLRGPNKIGRDPQTCSIVLNLNSVSRQHAVINVLNSKEYMLMDLDSANKTKLLNKTLKPYIPHPIRNGDTVQFGDIFGIFRLLEEDDELPMTQAIDIPETPLPSKPVSKIHKVQTTVIPESPDVSGDDSFLTASHPNTERTRLSSGQFIKSFGKTLSIQPVSSPKTPNNHNSPRRSTSLSFVGNPNTSLNESFVSHNSDKIVNDNIHEMDTQPPNANESNDSIYTAETQVPPARPISPSIYSLNTQLPSADNLPEIRKIDNQQDMQFDLYAANKENDTSIFNAETQPFGFEKNELIEGKKSFDKQNAINDAAVSDGLSKPKLSVNTSEEELTFDVIDDDFFEDDLNSQNLLLDEIPLVEAADPNETINPVNNKTSAKRANRIESDSSTDCEDMMPTQKVEEIPVKNDSKPNIGKVDLANSIKPTKSVNGMQSDNSTDCEDDIMPTQKVAELPLKNVSKQNIEKVDLSNKVKPTKNVNGMQSDSSTDCEDIDTIPTQKIPERKVNEDDDVTDCEDDEIPTNKPIETGDHTKFEDMPTQIIDVDYNKTDKPTNNNVDIEDQATQILEEIVPREQPKTTFIDLNSSFKIPIQSPKRVKNKDVVKPSPANQINISKANTSTDDHNYYQATQDIFDDLCSQRETSPDILQPNQDDEANKITIDLVSSPDKKNEDALNKLQKSLSNQRASDAKGASLQVASLRKVPSDSSDVESTPKKLRPFIFTDSDLPSSQEITTCMMAKDKSAVVELSSESEQENTEEQYTPIVHRKKKTKPAPKLDLSKKFEIEMLPERILTRQRKPTDKLGSSTDKNISSKMLKSTYLLDQEDQIDQEIISENIKRLKTFEKAKSMRDSKNDVSVKDDVKETSSLSKDSKSKEPKEKLKVKIEKPKKKETKSKSESSVRKSDEKQNNQEDDSTITEAKTRRTRGRKRENETKENTKNKNKSVSPENNKKEAENKRPRNKRKEKSKSPEIEIRRSKRNQTTKDKSLDGAMKAPKPILKNVRESNDYNLSSSSGEPNRSLKRSLVEDSVVPSPKRTRSHVNSTSSGINNASLRATPARLNKTHHVLFTAFPSEEVKSKLEKLGAVIVTDVLQCSVVLTMQVKRTFKLLCAVGLGKPIVGPAWVQACVDTNIIVDPWLYLVKDEYAEKRFQFNLERSLTGKRNFLKGYNVSSTLSVQPNATEMKLIVECSGGSWREGGPHWVCVSCAKDKGLWASLRQRGAVVVSTEFILGGVLKQKLDVAAYTFP